MNMSGAAPKAKEIAAEAAAAPVVSLNLGFVGVHAPRARDDAWYTVAGAPRRGDL